MQRHALQKKAGGSHEKGVSPQRSAGYDKQRRREYGAHEKHEDAVDQSQQKRAGAAAAQQGVDLIKKARQKPGIQKAERALGLKQGIVQHQRNTLPKRPRRSVSGGS